MHVAVDETWQHDQSSQADPPTRLALAGTSDCCDATVRDGDGYFVGKLTRHRVDYSRIVENETVLTYLTDK
jgi:hypothetical protein